MPIRVLALAFIVLTAPIAGRQPSTLPTCTSTDPAPIRAHEQALERDAADLAAHLALARCYDRAWMWPQAESILERALERFEAPTVTTRTDDEAANQGLLRGGVQVAMPRRTRDAVPDYPYAPGRTGFVILELIVDERGNVREATAARPVEGLNTAAIEIARKWKYAPTRLNGRSVAVVLYAGVRFGDPGEAIPSDSIDLAEFHHAAGRTGLVRADLIAALARTREEHQRYPGLLLPQDIPHNPTVTLPVLTRKVDPRYSVTAYVTKSQGTVEVEGIIDRHGRFGRLRTITAPGIFDGPAIEAARQWRFTPGHKDGQPVAIVGRAMFAFTVK